MKSGINFKRRGHPGKDRKGMFQGRGPANEKTQSWEGATDVFQEIARQLTCPQIG